MAMFYERLVSLVKQGVRKGIGRKLLSWDKLLTMVTEVEAIVNTRPLTYVYGDFLSGFTLTPVHFLTGNLDTVIPFNLDDCEDVEFQQRKDSAQDLTEYWKKSQKQLLALRETLPLSHKKQRSQISRQPKIGEIVLVKEDSLPRRAWKLTLIKEYILSKDGEIRSIIIQLPNKQLVSRAINHLFPLEIQAVQSEAAETKSEQSTETSDVHIELIILKTTKNNRSLYFESVGGTKPKFSHYSASVSTAAKFKVEYIDKYSKELLKELMIAYHSILRNITCLIILC